MRVAALYDIHANLPALEAVLADVDAEQPDAIVIGGDFALGPMPVETVDVLRGLGDKARFIRGNCEREIVAGTGWEADRLGPERLAFLAEVPETIVIVVDGIGPVCFCHGSPRSDAEIITAITPEARLREILTGVAEPVVVCGHTHHQFDRLVDVTEVVNAGSVGMPYEGRQGAFWAMLGPVVELRRTEYDVDAAAGRIVATGWPGADELAKDLRSPVAAEEAAAVFEEQAGR